jgi:hypothetical protein
MPAGTQCPYSHERPRGLNAYVFERSGGSWMAGQTLVGDVLGEHVVEEQHAPDREREEVHVGVQPALGIQGRIPRDQGRTSAVVQRSIRPAPSRRPIQGGVGRHSQPRTPRTAQTPAEGEDAEVPWLLERVPFDTPLGRDLAELDRRTRTGADALAYWDSWRARGQRIERRRLRTRNAIIHGGPLSPTTVDSVALFAEHLASQALITSLDAKLEGKTIASYFQRQQRRIADMRRRLESNDPSDPPGDILFVNSP